MAKQSIAGQVSITRRSSNQGPDEIMIAIRDKAACIEFALVSLSLEDFAAAVTGLGHRPCVVEVRGLDRVGMVREHKEEQVEYSGPSFRPDKLEVAPEALAALAPFEVDGWKGSLTDLLNGHRSARNAAGVRTQIVGFDRWVPAPAPPAEAQP